MSRWDDMFDYNLLERNFWDKDVFHEFLKSIIGACSYGWMMLVCMCVMFHLLDPWEITWWMVSGVATVCTLILGFVWWVYIMLYPSNPKEEKPKLREYPKGRL